MKCENWGSGGKCCRVFSDSTILDRVSLLIQEVDFRASRGDLFCVFYISGG